MRPLIVLPCLLLAACSASRVPVDWQHDGAKNSLQLERDLADCHMYLDATQDKSGAAPPHRMIHEWDDEFRACMAERGWQPR